MSTIINVRGTSGSGKSTIVHTLLRKFDHEVLEHFGVRGNRPLVYRVKLPLSAPLYIFGPYHTQCGGCDGILKYQDVLPELLPKYAPKGHVLFEGLLISGGYGSVGRAMGALAKKHRVVFATMDTPLETCLERVNGRRAARGVLEPVNPKNTEQKYKAAMASHVKIAEQYGHECVLVNHKRPVSQVLGILGVKISKEPAHATAHA